MNPHLFVYGTLLSTVDHPMGERLRREGTLIGPATFPGRLYRVAWYPGLLDGGAGDVVHGELLRLREPERSFVWLDEFEGVTRGDSSVTGPSEYERVQRSVTGPDGPLRAWAYLYRGSIGACEPVPGGRWRP